MEQNWAGLETFISTFEFFPATIVKVLLLQQRLNPRFYVSIQIWDFSTCYSFPSSATRQAIRIESFLY